MGVMNEPKYLTVARGYIGTREVPGPKHNGVIRGWLSKLGAWWHDDETPWCGVFVAACLQEAGLPYPKAYYRARSYVDYGEWVPCTRLGAVVVLSRTGGGHVGFLTGRTADGAFLRVLGGNQGNMVCEAWFEASRVVDSRCPPGVKLEQIVPTVKMGAKSRGEA